MGSYVVQMQRGNTWDLKWTCVLKIPNLQVISLGGLLPLHLGELRGFLATNWLQQLLILAALLLGGVQSCSSSKTGRCEFHRFGAAFCETQEAVCSWLSLMDSQNNVKICRRIDLATNPPKPLLLGQKHVKQVGQQPQEDHLRLRLASICLVCFPFELVRPRTRKTSSAVSSATTTSSSDGLGQSLRTLRWVCVCVRHCPFRFPCNPTWAISWSFYHWPFATCCDAHCSSWDRWISYLELARALVHTSRPVFLSLILCLERCDAEMISAWRGSSDDLRFLQALAVVKGSGVF